MTPLLLPLLSAATPTEPPKEEEDPKARKGGAAPKAAGKAKVEEPAEPAVPPPPPTDAPGWDTLAELFSLLRDRARQYDEWRARVTVRTAGVGSGVEETPSMELYKQLMRDVPAQRFSVPLLLHCILEQVRATARTV